MQLFFEGSEESPGVAGMGILPGRFRRFPKELPVPQLGWNRVLPSAPGAFVKAGWAYFANSYRLSEGPADLSVSWSEYGETFVAALESPSPEGRPSSLLLCQFHPELSGPWGLELIGAWLRKAAPSEGGAS
jgi:imidazoleglycerol phosphate synthase glutamine amidotransferase subunit HisH